MTDKTQWFRSILPQPGDTVMVRPLVIVGSAWPWRGFVCREEGGELYLAELARGSAVELGGERERLGLEVEGLWYQVVGSERETWERLGEWMVGESD